MNGFGNSTKIYGYVQSVALIHIQLSIQAVMKANVEPTLRTDMSKYENTSKIKNKKFLHITKMIDNLFLIVVSGFDNKIC
jgi:hypothetical protein